MLKISIKYQYCKFQVDSITSPKIIIIRLPEHLYINTDLANPGALLLKNAIDANAANTFTLNLAWYL